MLTGMPLTTAEMTGHNRILRTSGSFHQERRFKARAGGKKRQIARRASNALGLKTYGQMEQLFPLHMARFCLMLADHYYSSSDAQQNGRTRIISSGQIAIAKAARSNNG